jgi:hypothetical protein
MTLVQSWFLKTLTVAALVASATFLAAQQPTNPSPEPQPPAAAPAAQPPESTPAGRTGEGPRGGRGMGMMMGGGNSGQVGEVNGDSFTLKTQMGATLTVKTTADTRFFGKDRTPAALKDLKAGDYVAAMGPVTEGVVQARLVALLDEAAVKRMEEFKANLGKTVIAGEVKEIADTKLTILRPDGQTQVIELDESTSLRRGREESITLADIKAGDRVFGNGELKNGVFVPKELRVMGAGGMRMREQREPAAPPK